MEHRHQQQVAPNVDGARHGNKQKRRFAVAQSSEDGGQQIVGNDEENATTTDADIARSLLQSFLGCLHERGDRLREADHDDEQYRGDEGKHDGGATDDRADLFRALFTHSTGDQHGYAHGELCDDERDQIEHLTARGYRRQTRRTAEASDDEQIDRAVCRLQHQRAENGQHESDQLFQNAALREIRFVIQVHPSLRTLRHRIFQWFESCSPRRCREYLRALWRVSRNTSDRTFRRALRRTP